MKTYRLTEIPKDGLQENLVISIDWVKEIFDNLFRTGEIIENTVTGQLNLRKTNDVVDLAGVIRFDRKTLCGRCGAPLALKYRIPFQATFAPMPSVKDHHTGETIDEEIEIPTDDTGFCFYTNDIIEVSPIINDEIALQMPIDDYCVNNENCKIPDQVQVEEHKEIDPRWGALKNLKINPK